MRLFNYVLRLSYDAPELACSRLDALINDYDSKFDLAYPVSHRRFKHHGLKHLAKYLRLWGTFRTWYSPPGLFGGSRGFSLPRSFRVDTHLV